MGQQKEYQIPGMGDVGTPGNRRSSKVTEIDRAFTDFKSGKGLVIEPNGLMHGGASRKAEELLANPQAVTELSELETSM